MAVGGSCGSFGVVDEMKWVDASSSMVGQKWFGREEHVAELSLGGKVGTIELKADFVWGGKVMVASSARDLCWKEWATWLVLLVFVGLVL